MKKLLFILTRFWKTISIFALITMLCLIPASEINKLHVEINFVDLVVHFIMFFTFASVLFSDLKKYYRAHNTNYSLLVISLVICILFGITTETLQYLLTFLNRSGSFVDLLFDVIGSLSGIGMVKFIKRKSYPGF
jgi:VanZ family protein